MKSLLETGSPELIEALKKTGRTKTLKAGAVLFAEGEQADFLPIILAGTVKMIHFLEPGKEVIIGIFGAGAMFAVPPVFDGAPSLPKGFFASLRRIERIFFYRN